MKLVFDTERLLLPISTSLQDALNRVISESGKWTPMIQSVVINFRDSSYSLRIPAIPDTGSGLTGHQLSLAFL